MAGAPTGVRAGAHEADERRGRGAGDAASRRECAKRRAGVGAVLRARRPAEPAQREATRGRSDSSRPSAGRESGG